MGTQQAKGALAETVDGIDPLIRKIQTGEFERSLSALTAVEIFLGHHKAIRGVRPLVAPGPLGAVRGGGGSPASARPRTVLPLEVDKYRARHMLTSMERTHPVKNLLTEPTPCLLAGVV